MLSCIVPMLNKINTTTLNKQIAHHEQHKYHNLIKDSTFKSFQLLIKFIKCHESHKKKSQIFLIILLITYLDSIFICRDLGLSLSL